MSLPYGPCAALVLSLWAAACPVRAESAGAGTPSGPVLGALGASVRVGPEHAGATGWSASLVPNFVLRWGRLTVSNGGPLASRFGEPVEAGLGADLFDLDRLKISASLSLDSGRDSDDTERLRGLHDIPAHLRGRLRLGWRLHSQWQLMGTWRADLSGQGTGSSLDLTLLHDWRPEFIDHHRWRISLGASLEALDARRANQVLGITPQDAQRTRFAPYRLDAGVSEWRIFTNWQREIQDGWVAYGGVGLSRLVGDAARSPIVVRPHGLAASFGLGRRF